MGAVLWSLAGTGFTFLMTIAGSVTVLFLRKEMKETVREICMGLAAGVMIASSFFSLLLPAIEKAKELPIPAFIVTGSGVICGCLAIVLVSYRSEQEMFYPAVIVHNIPEGMVVGIAFAYAMTGITTGNLLQTEEFTGAILLAIGIGIQNIPEGAATAYAMRISGKSKTRAFILGSLSGIVEPIAGALSALFLSFMVPLMSFLLAFAAGAMLFTVLGELIPTNESKPAKTFNTIAVMAGFIIMMILDTTL